MDDPMKDRRIQRTRGLLLDALQDLMIEKGYEAITVQDIIDRANIGRSTFYSHYADKDELLADSIDHLKRFLHGQMRMRQEKRRDGRNGEEVTHFKFSHVLLEHIRSHKMLYKATVGKQSGILVMHYMKNMITELAKAEIAAWIPDDPNPSSISQDLAVEFVVNTLFTLIHWWMDHNRTHTPEDVDRIFHQFVIYGITQYR